MYLYHKDINTAVSQLWDSFLLLGTEKQVRTGLRSYILRRTHLLWCWI